MMHHRSTATAAAALAIALCASLPARAQTARLGGLPASAQVVTNEQDAAALAALNAANAVLSAAITNEAALRAAGDAAGLAAVNATNAVLSAAITNEAALRTAGDAAGLAALYATNAVLRAALTNEAALRAAHTNRTDNPHSVTAQQIGALTNETDTVALAAMPFNIFDATKNVIWKGAGTNANTTQSVLIGDRAGNAVTGSTIIAIGRDAAREIVPLAAIGPETELSVIAIGENAAEQAGGIWAFAYNIAIGNSAFKEGAGQSSIAIGQDALDKTPGAFTTIAIGREAGRTAAAEQMIAIGYQAGEQAGLTNSVVIGANAGRLASGQNILVIDSSGNDDSSYPARAMIYGNANDLTLGRIDSDNNSLRGSWDLNGAALATTQYVADAIAAPYTAWTGTITPANGTATVTIAHGNMPVLVTAAPCVLTLDPTGYGTSGVSRVSLSYYPGTNSFTFATNIIQYAETPTVDTNGWNTLLIRRVSNGEWKGVGL